MGRRGYLDRYQCNDCEMFFRDSHVKKCPFCNSCNIKIIARGVGE